MQGLEDAFGAPVIERYGMSEASDLTYNPLPPAVRKPGTVGIPGINEVKIIDERGATLGPNREGEIVARGPSVFDGYWDDPVANEAAFIDGWFRTGDLGRFDEDGYLTITGRIKDLINRGGEKLSPVEVEAVLCEHPMVAAACVFPMPHSTLGEEVLAAVVPVPGSDIVERELLAHARVGLAAFKVPRRILLCESLPKGRTGKVQRSLVAQMCRSMLAHNGGTEADLPGREPSAVERELLALWNAVLGTETADLDQDFFLAGGDSLRMGELFARIRERLGVTLGLGQIFDEPATISGIARLIERTRTSGSVQRDLPAGLVPIKADGDHPPLFAVPGNGGNPIGFVHIGRLLEQRRPFYGIESRGLDGTSPPLDRMEDIAADNIRRIKTLLPDGPYFLAGACFGARVAYEMARQLDAAGERVGLLLMLDPSPPFTDGRGRPRVARAGGRDAMRFSTSRFVLDRVVLHARTIAALRGAERRAYLRQKLALVGEILRQRDMFRGDRSELYQRATHEANLRAGRHYIPGSYFGATIVCLTRDRPVLSNRDYRLDWLKLVPQCGGPIYTAGRDSADMMNLANSYVLAERINGCLEAASSGNDRGTKHGAIQSAAQ
jgi:thioesterase domain-containing protein